MAWTRKITIAGIAVLFIAAIAAMFFHFRQFVPTESSVDVRKDFSDITFKNIDGQDVTFASMRGKPVVAYVWASWCERCVRDIYSHALLQKEFGDAVMFAEVNRGESLEIAKKFVDPKAGLSLFADGNDALYKALGGFAMPETIFIDKNGIVRNHTRGHMSTIDLRRRIQDSFAL